jgi:hypothetical protein
MILELLFLLFVTCTVFFGLNALRALIIRRWIADSIQNGTLIQQEGDDNATRE